MSNTKELNDEELYSLLNKGKELHSEIQNFIGYTFSSYSIFGESYKPLKEKFESLSKHLDKLLLDYPNNDENSAFISRLGSIRNILSILENSINPSQVNGKTTWIISYPQLFKKPSSPYNQVQQNKLKDQLSILQGSLNLYADFLEKENKPTKTLIYSPSHNEQSHFSNK